MSPVLLYPSFLSTESRVKLQDRKNDDLQGLVPARGETHTQGIRPYALCVTLFNGFRRLVLGAYCVVFGGIPVHNEGILGGSRDYTMSIYFHSTSNLCPSAQHVAPPPLAAEAAPVYVCWLLWIAIAVALDRSGSLWS